MDANAGRVLAERLAERTGGDPTPPIRGTEQATEAAPIFRWFAVQPPPVKPA